MKNHNVEVLAPAGSYDIMKAVINAGADAVYLGGDMFGARAYAGNLNKEEMIRALDYAHLRDKKIYLTVNTLLKENECTHELVDYIAPFYEAGLDACIVQDMGVFKILHSAHACKYADDNYRRKRCINFKRDGCNAYCYGEGAYA